MIWVVFALMTGFAVFSVLWPLSRQRRDITRREIETNLYHAEIAGIDRDVERGLMTSADAAAAKAESARRLLAQADQAPHKTSRFSVKLAALLAICVIPAGSLGLYSYLGAPDYTDMPLQARMEGKGDDLDMAAAIARIEQHLAREPDDARGWEVLANVYRQLGKPASVARAYRQLLRIEGPSAQLLFVLGEALVYANDGRVDEEALQSFEKALAADASIIDAQYYIGLAAQQRGEPQKAMAIFTKMIAEAPPGAQWVDVLRERIAQMGGTAPAPSSAPAPSAAMPAPSPEQDAAIRGMVLRLAERLSSQGGSADEWSRLVRSYAVLKETDKARAALEAARKQHQGEGALFDALAKELGLGG